MCKCIESNNLTDIFNLLSSNKRQLIICDIDDTLITTKQMLGGDRWFKYSISKHMEQGLSPRTTVSKILPLYNSLQIATEATLVEKSTPQVIAQLQAQHVLIALTARDARLADATLKQLADNNIKFDPDTTADLDGDINNLEFAQIKQGIIFCNGPQNKARCLELFIQQKGINNLPEEIIYIDDSKANLQAVAELCDKLNMPIHTIHYTKNLELPSIDQNIVAIQHEYFGKILSDKDAALIANNRPV